MYEQNLSQVESEMLFLTGVYRDAYHHATFSTHPARVAQAHELLESGSIIEGEMPQGMYFGTYLAHQLGREIELIDEKYDGHAKKHLSENLGAYQELAAIDAYKSGVDLNIANPLHPDSKNNKSIDFDAAAFRFWTGGTATGLVGVELLNIDPVKVLPVSVVVGLSWAIKNYRDQKKS